VRLSVEWALAVISIFWWVLAIVLCAVRAIKCPLEGNSVNETIAVPLLVVAWGRSGLSHRSTGAKVLEGAK
jgi:hypothetical protein